MKETNSKLEAENRKKQDWIDAMLNQRNEAQRNENIMHQNYFMHQKIDEQIKVIAQDNFLIKQRLDDKENDPKNRRKSLGIYFKKAFKVILSL